MFTKIILFAVLAACGAPSIPATTELPAEQPDKLPPDDERPMDQILYCEGNWVEDDGKVTCE